MMMQLVAGDVKGETPDRRGVAVHVAAPGSGRRREMREQRERGHPHRAILLHQALQ
jgi:hypothetical protein